MKTVLFHRDFQEFTGGHLKVWNYFNHVEASPSHTAQIHFSPDSRWDASNPWVSRRAEVCPQWQPEQADLLFLGGKDWEMLPAAERDHYRWPVINLIQHVHHADPGHPLSAFLPHRAIRVCVSAEVRAAIESTGRVNGPTVTIPNGIEMADLPTPGKREIDWLVCGLKDGRSGMARRLVKRLDLSRWGRAEFLTKLLPRPEFLAALARARRVVLLPRETEGFYLPALEAMALGCLVVCSDCVGNRSFCREGFNAVVPVGHDEESVFAAMQRARRLTLLQEAALVENARVTAAEHTLARERAAFHELLASVDALW